MNKREEWEEMSVLDNVDLYELHPCMHALGFLATCFANLFSATYVQIYYFLKK